MSTRYEWTRATYTTATRVKPGERADGEPVEPGYRDAEGVAVDGAIMLGYDEAFVIEGTPAELHALIDRMRAALPPL